MQLESAVTDVMESSTASARAPAIVTSSTAPDLGSVSRGMVKSSARRRAAETDIDDAEQGVQPAGRKRLKTCTQK
jgi:hypothetical protein